MDTMQPRAANENFPDAPPPPGLATDGPTVIDALGALSIDLPPPCRVRDADYVRVMDDLMLSQNGEHRVILVDFFRGTMQCDLWDETGCLMPGEIARLLAVSLGPITDDPPPASVTDNQPIGKVGSLSGCACFIRRGLRSPIACGSRIYRGDVLQTSENSRLGLSFSDGSSIAAGENACLVLAELNARHDTAPSGQRQARLFLVTGSFVAIGASGMALNGHRLATGEAARLADATHRRSGTTDNTA